MQRVRQFVRAVFARLTVEDRAYIEKHLSADGQSLFFDMNVAYTAEAMAEEKKLLLDKKLLIRCALLHDVGRRKGDMGIFGKVFAVLMQGFFPAFSRKWAREGQKSLLDYPRHALYVYYYHPEIGAELLKNIGLMKEAEIIRHHQEPQRKGDSLVLCLLRQADELN